MEVGVSLGTGLSVRPNVVEEPKPGPNFATTLLQNTVVQTVKGTTLKLGSVVLKIAQVIFISKCWRAPPLFFHTNPPGE